MLHETLKQATKQNHDELEKLMFVNDIMAGTLSLLNYKQILYTNYLVHNAFEDDLFDNLSPELAKELNIENRRKLPALLADMESLQMAIPDPVNDRELVFDKNDASILGAMYVLEGATLGGSIIVKRLNTNPQLSALSLNFNYYQVYGNELISYWKSFCATLDQQPEENYHAAVQGAQKMFGYIAALQLQNNNLVA